MKQTMIRCTFYSPENAPEGTCECEIDWDDRKAVRQFAIASNKWLRRGPGYRVETEAV